MKCLKCGSEQKYIKPTNQYCIDCSSKRYFEIQERQDKIAQISPVDVALMRIDAIASLLNISSLSIDTELKRLHPEIYNMAEEIGVRIFDTLNKKGVE